MAQFRMPPPDVVIIDVKTGRLTNDGYDLFKSLERLGFADLADVSPTPPTNTQVPIWNTTTGLWTPGTN
jgi:hypothetical protein